MERLKKTATEKINKRRERNMAATRGGAVS